MALESLQPGQALGIHRVVECSLPANTFAATQLVLPATVADAKATVAI